MKVLEVFQVRLNRCLNSERHVIGTCAITDEAIRPIQLSWNSIDGHHKVRADNRSELARKCEQLGFVLMGRIDTVITGLKAIGPE